MSGTLVDSGIWQELLFPWSLQSRQEGWWWKTNAYLLWCLLVICDTGKPGWRTEGNKKPFTQVASEDDPLIQTSQEMTQVTCEEVLSSWTSRVRIMVLYEVGWVSGTFCALDSSSLKWKYLQLFHNVTRIQCFTWVLIFSIAMTNYL